MDISELSFLQWHGIKLSSGLSQNMDKPASPAAKMQSTGNFKARTSRFCMVVDLEEKDEVRLRRTMMIRTTTTTMTTTFFLQSEAKQKMLSEAKQTPAEQLAFLSRASGVQF